MVQRSLSDILDALCTATDMATRAISTNPADDINVLRVGMDALILAFQADRGVAFLHRSGETVMCGNHNVSSEELSWLKRFDQTCMDETGIRSFTFIPDAATEEKTKCDDWYRIALGDDKKKGVLLLRIVPRLGEQTRRAIETFSTYLNVFLAHCDCAKLSNHCELSDARRHHAVLLTQADSMVTKLRDEIRNPLAGLLAGLHYLGGEIDFPERYRDVLDDLVVEGKRLAHALRKLPEEARRVPIQPEISDLAALLEECVGECRAMACQQRFLVECTNDAKSKPSDVAVDRSLFKRALQTLFRYALGTQQSGNRVRVCWSEVRGNTVARLSTYAGNVVVIVVGKSNLSQTELNCLDMSTSGTDMRADAGNFEITVARDIVEMHGGILEMATDARAQPLFRMLLPAGQRSPCWSSACETPCTRKDDVAITCVPKKTPGDVAVARSESSAIDPSGVCASQCPADCAVFARSAGFNCWQVLSAMNATQTEEWPELCQSCPVFLLGNLRFHYKCDNDTQEDTQTGCPPSAVPKEQALFGGQKVKQEG